MSAQRDALSGTPSSAPTARRQPIKPADVLKPKTVFDRTLARMEHQRIWEHTPGAVDLAIDIARKAVGLADDPDCPDTTRLRAWQLATQIVKEIFVDRTIPTVQRVTGEHAVFTLPMGRQEQELQVAGDPEATERMALRSCLKRLCEGGFGEAGAVLNVKNSVIKVPDDGSKNGS